MKKIICFLFVFVLLLNSALPCFADFGTVGFVEIGAASLAMAEAYGINLGFSSYSGSQVSDWINSEIMTYSNGDPGSKFTIGLIESAAGKLIIPSLVALQINDFLEDLIDRLGLGSVSKEISGSYQGIPIFQGGLYSSSSPGGALFSDSISSTGICAVKSGDQATLYRNGNQLGRAVDINFREDISCDTFGFYLNGDGTLQWCVIVYQNYYGELRYMKRNANLLGSPGAKQVVTGDIADYEGVWSIGDDKVISVGSQDWDADTNLDQMLGGIFDQYAEQDINIDVTEEDVPVPPTPVPTPIPIEPDTPLQDVPWEGLNDLLDMTNGSLDDINNEIINAGQGIDNISGQLDNIGTQIGEQTTSISGALDQAATDTVEAIEGTTAAVNDIADILNPQDIDETTFDLRELFPFCIPFDIYHLLQKFDSTPAAPHVQLPIVIPSIGFSYTMDLDFSAWDPVASAMRTVELIVYALGLAWATSKVIKW